MAKLHDKCFSPSELQLLLDNQLDRGSESDVLRHMDSCAACQAALESLAASKELWNELPENLTEEGSFECHELMETSEHQPGTVDVNIEDLLSNIGPTDDPNMLGRIGTYEICGVVGRGSTGIVLKSFESSLNRYVAIKVLSPALSNNGAARRRFEREARAIAAVVNEHVVPIFAVDEHRGLPYFVMQYVSGASLQHRIERQGPLDACEVTRISMQIANGLAAAHAQGIVHRDIKPANILLEHGLDRVMVSDFGLARVTDGATVTMSGMITGTPSYMAPEQARGDQVDQRSDLFSLGSVMYTMCTARTPFPAETVYGVIRRICEAEPRSIRESNPEIPAWLESFIRKLMSKKQEDRFGSAEQVAAVLSHELAHLQNPTLVQSPPREWAATIQSPPARLPARKQPMWMPALWGGLAALAIVTAAGFLTNGTAEPQAESTSDSQVVGTSSDSGKPIVAAEQSTQDSSGAAETDSRMSYLDKEALSKARLAAKAKSEWEPVVPAAKGPAEKAELGNASAIAVPVNAIKIDGDSSDWPKDMKSYAIERAEVGQQPTGADDLSASFKIGYSEADQALYVLVEVVDDSPVTDAEAARYHWNAQDGCELYLDKRHDPNQPMLAQYTRYGESLNAYGTNDGVKGVGLIVGKEETKRIYEWRVDLENGVEVGTAMGFDLAILDKDQDGSFTWLTWGSGTQKIYADSHHGHILLVNGEQRLGEAVGESNWPSGSSHVKKQVRLQSLSSPKLWTAVSCTEAGNYRVVLPAGSYSVSVVDDVDHRFEQAADVQFSVEPDQTVDVELLEISAVKKTGHVGGWHGAASASHGNHGHYAGTPRNLMSSNADSRNDSIAVAYPVSDITVDGDLSDWPEGMKTYTLGDGKIGAAIESENDLAATYRVGYSVDEQAIYVAIQVVDDSFVMDEHAGRDWSAQDGSEVYLDSEHRLGAARVDQHSFYGNSLGAPTEKVEVAAELQPTGRTYEWRIATDEVISAGRSLGFDVSILDKDEDKSFSWIAWGRGTQKAWYPDRCGNLLLLDPETEFGTVAGSVEASGDGLDYMPRICFQSLSDPGLRPRIACDEDGNYSAELPVGKYLVTPTGQADGNVRVEVLSGETATTVPISIAD